MRTSAGLARRAVATATVAAGALGFAAVWLGAGYLVGGGAAVEDTWVGYLGGAALVGGLVVSLAAFAMAVTARARRERSTSLWLPLALFPVLVAFLLLGEIFWWE